MMHFLIGAAALLILHWVTSYWWWIIVVPLGLGFWRSESALAGFRTGAASAGLLWLAASLYAYFDGGRAIAARIAEMLGSGSGYSIAFLAAVLAGLVAGLSGFAGYQFRSILSGGRQKRPESA